MQIQSQHRNVALDVIRCIALFLVISVHFFIYTGFYGSIMVGSRLYLFTLVRTLSMTCVPLFLMLSGYLMKNKTPSRRYYSKLIKTICLYFMASACCYLYQTRFSGNVLDYLLQTLNYTASAYAWYINMYIGLFLLIPYLNVLYRGLPDRRSRQGLIFTLLIMTAFTGLVNCFVPSGDGGWQFSKEVALYQTILPDWWHKIYPLTYYFVGAYLRDHPLNLSKKQNLLFLVLAIAGNGTLNYTISYGQEFLQGSWQDWGSALNVLQSALLFSLLSRTEFSFLPVKVCSLIRRISDLSLSAFLVSWIFDSIFYPVLIQYQPSVSQRLLFYPAATVLIFVCSLCLAWVLDTLYAVIYSGVCAMRSRKLPQ